MNKFKQNGQEPHSGIYITHGAFIAMRDNDQESWRLSKMEPYPNNSVVLTLIGTYKHKWQVEEIMYQ